LQEQENKEVSQQSQIFPKLNLDESYDLFFNFKEKNAISPRAFKKISCKHCKRLEQNSPRSLGTKNVTAEKEIRTSISITTMVNVSNTSQDEKHDSKDTGIHSQDKSDSEDDESINLVLELDADSINESIQDLKNHDNLEDLIFYIIGKFYFYI
jgi:hypothetical protein